MTNSKDGTDSGAVKRGGVFKDITGKRFGLLRVIDIAFRANGKIMWNCVCDCGTVKIVRGAHLNHGKINSCGCNKRIICAKVNTIHGHTHRHRCTTEYRSWSGMKTRCNNPTNRAFKWYGARGISYDPRWNDFSLFLQDMGMKPSPELSLERIDNSLGYSKANCKWGTDTEQNNNRRFNVVWTLNGRSQTIAQWAREIGLCPSTLHSRINYGWPVEDIITKPKFYRPSRKAKELNVVPT